MRYLLPALFLMACGPAYAPNEHPIDGGPICTVNDVPALCARAGVSCGQAIVDCNGTSIGVDCGRCDGGLPDGGCLETSDCPFNSYCESNACVPAENSCVLPVRPTPDDTLQCPQGDYLSAINVEICGETCPVDAEHQSNHADSSPTCNGGPSNSCLMPICVPVCTDTGVCPSGFHSCERINNTQEKACGLGVGGAQCWAAASGQ